MTLTPLAVLFFRRSQAARERKSALVELCLFGGLATGC
jgi:hypothetical protein